MDEQKAIELARQSGAEITDYFDHAASEDMIVFLTPADLMKFVKKVEEQAGYHKTTVDKFKAEFEDYRKRIK